MLLFIPILEERGPVCYIRTSEIHSILFDQNLSAWLGLARRLPSLGADVSGRRFKWPNKLEGCWKADVERNANHVSASIDAPTSEDDKLLPSF